VDVKLTVTAPIGALDRMGLTVCTFVGDYAQLGHFGRSRGTFTCDDGSHGEHMFRKVTVRRLGWMRLWSALLTASYSSGCTMNAILRWRGAIAPTSSLIAVDTASRSGLTRNFGITTGIARRHAISVNLLRVRSRCPVRKPRASLRNERTCRD
jgi:hypothetical protein